MREFSFCMRVRDLCCVFLRAFCVFPCFVFVRALMCACGGGRVNFNKRKKQSNNENIKISANHIRKEQMYQVNQ